MSIGEFRVGDFNGNSYRVGQAISADQELLMKIGIAANGNVNIQSRVKQWETQVRLFCKMCGVSENVNDTSVLSKGDAVSDQIATFCVKHRHDEYSPYAGRKKALAVFGIEDEEKVEEAPVGRRFREEDYSDNEQA